MDALYADSSIFVVYERMYAVLCRRKPYIRDYRIYVALKEVHALAEDTRPNDLC